MSYKELIERISALNGSRILGHVGDTRDQFPLFVVRRGIGKKVLLSGAVHGDEPAGAHAIISFLENGAEKYENAFEFTAFPCVNPWGFQYFARGNADGINLNRDFKKDPISQETKLIMPRLEQYVFAADLHETWPESTRVGSNEPTGDDPSAFYLWEVCKDISARVGVKILNNIARVGLPICKWPSIYGDKNNNGVIWYPENCGTACYASEGPFDTYLAANHTEQSFTIETPRGWQLADRVLAHKISIQTILDAQIKNQT